MSVDTETQDETAEVKKLEIVPAITNKTRSNNIIRQANALTTAAYSLGVNEKRLVYLALDSIVRNKHRLVSNSFGQYPVEISHTEFSNLFDYKGNAALRDIKNASESLNAKEVVFYLSEEDSDDGERALDALSWTTKRSFRPRRGTTILYFNAELIDIILNVNKNYTQLLMGDITTLKSAHSMRLYDSLKQYEHLGKAIFTLEWMIERYQLSEKYLSRINDFRRRFLVPSVKEINEKTSINVSYREIASSSDKRRMEKIEFTIQRKPGTEGKPSSFEPTLENAVKTYMELSEKTRLPTKPELENLKRFTSELMLDGFEFTAEFVKNMKKALEMTE